MCKGHPPAALADLQRLAVAAPTGDPEIAAMLEAAEPDMTGFATLPREHWQKVWSNNPIKRPNREIKRRADVVQTFPRPRTFGRQPAGPRSGSPLRAGSGCGRFSAWKQAMKRARETLSLVADALRVAVSELFASIDDADFGNRVEALDSRAAEQQSARDRAVAAWRGEHRASIATALDGFTLADLSVTVFASPETFTALYNDIIGLLETKYEQSTWEVHSQDDVTEDPEYRNALDRLRQEAEVASRCI